ncbi:MAG: zinc ribbon domain-containing protein [Lachnospiraceae bacterium]|nr:zinc ribbon domain-containing protein [Lachnospiraceae bacterium]
MFCNECGANLPDGSKFCNVCGVKLIVPQMSERNAQSDYVQQYQASAQPDYEQQYQQNYIPESQPSSADSGKSKKTSKKKLPTWAKVWIAVCVLAVIGIGTFLTIHFIKGKKSSGSYVTVNGTRCDITYEDGLSNLSKLKDGIIFMSNDINPTYDYYKDGELVSSSQGEGNEQPDVVVRKPMINLGNDSVIHNGAISICFYKNANFKFADGTSAKSTSDELEKAGYYCDGYNCYSKLYDKNGEITLDGIESDYDNFLKDGFEGLDYSAGIAFPDIFYSGFFKGSKEDNRQAIKDAFDNSPLKVNNIDDLLKSRLLFAKEISKLTGMNKNGEYIGSTIDFLVKVDYCYSRDGYMFTTITIYGSKERLNSYMTKWGLTDSVLFKVESRMTTEDYDQIPQARGAAEEPNQEIDDGADIFDADDVPKEPWEISVSDIPEYDALVHFFDCLDIYRDGNYERYYDSDEVLSGDFDILYHLISPFICVDRQGLYPLYNLETVWGEVDDPRGYISDENSPWHNMGYNHVSLEGLKWVAVNIFNVKEGDYDILLNKLLDENECYIENGRLYFMIGGIGWMGDLFEIKTVKTDGTFYYITYNKVPDPEYGFEEEIETYEAKMQLKNIDGVNYWSMYYNHKAE